MATSDYRYNSSWHVLSETVRQKGEFSISPQVGLGGFLVERSFFPENKRNDQERSHRSKKKRLERVLKNIERFIVKERNRNCLKKWLKSLTRSYYQERVLSWERILNKECVLNHLEIVKDFFI